jgi:hypothetical protein
MRQGFSRPSRTYQGKYGQRRRSLLAAQKGRSFYEVTPYFAGAPWPRLRGLTAFKIQTKAVDVAVETF